MLPAERYDRIKDYILQNKYANISELAAMLNTSVPTVRRCLKQLEADNTIKRTKFDIERVMRFQETVMQVLQECDPALAQKVVTRLAAMDATVSALDFGIGAAAETL